MNNEAVLDRETGLVWQRDTIDTMSPWYNAQEYCYGINIGGRKGWRLPTIEELATLVDPTETIPSLPDGHLFTNTKSSHYWSSTTEEEYHGSAWYVHFQSSNTNCTDKYNDFYVRCVRAR